MGEERGGGYTKFALTPPPGVGMGKATGGRGTERDEEERRIVFVGEDDGWRWENGLKRGNENGKLISRVKERK